MSNNFDYLTLDDTKKKLLKKALLAVSKDLDDMFGNIDEQTSIRHIMKQRLKKDEIEVFNELSRDPEFMTLINKWIDETLSSKQASEQEIV